MNVIDSSFYSQVPAYHEATDNPVEQVLYISECSSDSMDVALITKHVSRLLATANTNLL